MKSTVWDQRVRVTLLKMRSKVRVWVSVSVVEKESYIGLLHHG